MKLKLSEPIDYNHENPVKAVSSPGKTSVNLKKYLPSKNVFVLNNCRSILSVDSIAKKHLLRVALDNGVKKIGDFVFDGANKLSSIELKQESKLQEIGKYAFFGTQISTINVPSQVSSIAKTSFAGTKQLKNITLDPNNHCFYQSDGDLYSTDESTLFRMFSMQTENIDYEAIYDELTAPQPKEDLTGLTGNITSDFSLTSSEELTANEITAETITIDDVKAMRFGFAFLSTLKDVCENALLSNDGVSSFCFPASLSDIAIGYSHPFLGCSALAEISIDNENPVYSTDGTSIYLKNRSDKNLSTLYLYGLDPDAHVGESFSTNKISCICNGAFTDVKLSVLDITDSTKKIESNVFRNAEIDNLKFSGTSKKADLVLEEDSLSSAKSVFRIAIPHNSAQQFSTWLIKNTKVLQPKEIEYLNETNDAEINLQNIPSYFRSNALSHVVFPANAQIKRTSPGESYWIDFDLNVKKITLNAQAFGCENYFVNEYTTEKIEELEIQEGNTKLTADRYISDFSSHINYRPLNYKLRKLKSMFLPSTLLSVEVDRWIELAESNELEKIVYNGTEEQFKSLVFVKRDNYHPNEFWTHKQNILTADLYRWEDIDPKVRKLFVFSEENEVASL